MRPSKVVAKKIKASSIIKIISIGVSLSVPPIFLILSILSLFGMATVYQNGQAVYGIDGFVIGIALGLFVTIISVFITSLLMLLGLWLYSLFRPITLQFVSLHPENSETEPDLNKPPADSI